MTTGHSITARRVPNRPLTLLLSGYFDHDALPDLEESVLQAMSAEPAVCIDLSEVTLVDRAALEYLSHQASKRVRLVNCPIYLRSWLKNAEQVSDDDKI